MELSAICELIVDCEHKTAPIQETGYPSIRTPNIGRGYFILDGVNRVSEETYKLWTRRAIPQPGDLIMAREAPVGNVALIPPGLQPCLGQRTLLIRPDRSKVDPSFLNYFLNGPHGQALIHAKTNGATVPHLNMKDVRTMDLPELPPLPLQRRIAGILSAYDGLIENSQRRIKILETMARALYREWFVEFRFPGHEKVKMVKSSLGMVPEGWEVKKLKDTCTLTMGQSPRSEYYNENGLGQPFHQGVSDFGDRFPTDRLFCTADGRIAEAGDILFSVRAPVGRMNIADKRIIIGRGLSAIRHKDKQQAFLWEQLRNRFTEDDMIGNGAIFAAVTKGDVEDIEIICPSENIVNYAKAHFIPIHNAIGSLTHQIQNLRQTRDLLLPRLMEGIVIHN